MTLAEGGSVNLERAIDHLQFVVHENSDLDTVDKLFEAALLRLVIVILILLFLAAWLLKRLLVRPLIAFSDEIDALREVSCAPGSEKSPEPGAQLTLHELQKRADLAMYTAKRPGSRKLVFYNEDMGGMAALLGNKEISAVFQAIDNPDLIELHYQSVMRLPMEQKEYVEALTRIRCDGELIGPGVIFPIVQARNLDREFDLAVLRALGRDLAEGRLPAGLGVSVNLSAPSIVNNQVVDALLELIHAHPGRKIVAEITETALITQIEIATSNIHRLRETGCLLALDDFGSGYSSLRYLTSMPVDLVKFDISMVRLLNRGDRRQQLMMEEISRLVLTAGYQMVAEGVDSRELLDQVIRLGFSHAQGFYFDRPQAPG